MYSASLHFLTTVIPAHFDPAVCSVRLYGEKNLLPEPYVAAARELEASMTGDGFRINLLAAYDAGVY